MKRLFGSVLLIVIMFLSACQPAPVKGSAGIGDSYYPELGNGGYDVQNYTLVLDIDPATNELNATETIDATATERLSSYDLDFQGLTVDSVTVNGSAAAYERQDHELVITPSKPLASGKSIVTEIQYHGNPEPER